MLGVRHRQGVNTVDDLLSSGKRWKVERAQNSGDTLELGPERGSVNIFSGSGGRG